MAEHIVDDDYSPYRSEDDLVGFNSNGQAAQWQPGILEFLLVQKGEVLVILSFCFLLDVILLEAQVPATHGNEVDAVFYLHLHAEYLVADELLLIVLVPAAEPEGECFFFILESIVFVSAKLLIDELDLISANIALVLIPRFVLILDSDEYYKKPLIDNGVEVEIDIFYHLILFMLVFSAYLELVLLFQADFIVLSQQLH